MTHWRKLQCLWKSVCVKISKKYSVTILKLQVTLKWRPLFKRRTSFYCLFWFESLVWGVNEGLWVQLSVVMRPLPHSFSPGHNRSATPTLGFSASPVVGSWRKLGGSAPSPLKCPSLWIRQQELPSEGAVKRTQLLLAPHSTLPPSPVTLQTRLTLGTRDCSFAVLRYGAGVTRTRSP